VAASWFLSLKPEVALADGAGGGVVLTTPEGRVTLNERAPAARAAIGRLAAPGESEEALLALVRPEGPAVLARWYYLVQHLARQGLLVFSLRSSGAGLAELVPVSPWFVLPPPRRPAGPCVLSRFAYLRREGDALVLESPRSFARLVLHDERTVALISALSRPRRPEELTHLGPDTPALLDALLGVGMVERVSESGGTAEDEAPLRSWEFHDLLFHARSRDGRHDGAVGAVFPQAGKSPPPPAFKSVPPGRVVELDRPDLGRLEAEGPTLDRVLARRCSVRRYAAEPITLGQLGEFLFRAARVRRFYTVEMDTPAGPIPLEFTSRPYPSGGALYEVELNVAVRACRGLEPGLYHHDPHGHRLEQLGGPSPEVAALFDDAALATGTRADELQLLIVLSSRFDRLAWKYASLAYALTLKHVGVIYQTLYLTATAMGLAPCAVGTGNPDLFARAAGLDPLAESSVGEFLLGSAEQAPQ
jgi:SagB-type dehydrogenase family enzyme